ncbi:hypothetical protein [Paracoccus saliphilus]|uniref:Uncharacterized protein n=1 Tax=Paracoccus saliphilus TaxID=405559 RepID=A0AA45W595_9RHOB|nr:hypothetical protein [Paracoccus saliphilus]WCR02221.1 hypothetical protein JHX88_15140 [Paracoccus saliphilus]SIS91436.1 hypothetical protein SAMN05421772_108146 [Paracoccus saliphilus]
MIMRSTTSMVTFSHPFTLSGYPDELPAGEYEVIVEEELLQGLSFEAYRRTATHLMVHGRKGKAGITEMRQISKTDLETALNRDGALAGNNDNRDAARIQQENLK